MVEINWPKNKKTEKNSEGDAFFIQAEPISKTRMNLLWMNPAQLAQLEKPLTQYNVVSFALESDSGMEEVDVTAEDYQWAKQIEKIVDLADAAAKRKDYAKSIQYYKEALRLAPGCDLYLMSIGTSYAYLGEKDRAIQYLERAAKISPNNSRIRENLANAKRLK